MSLSGKSMRVGTQLALGLLALATGCASPPQNITFSDEAEIRAAHASLPGSLIRKLDHTDEAQIELAAFSYLLEQHLWMSPVARRSFCRPTMPRSPP